MDHKLLVVVPYRDRPEHFAEFLGVMPQYLHEENIEATIMIVEQADDYPFNRGKLLNVGVLEANLAPVDYDYIAFHDVDMLPKSPGAGYHYCPTARQVHCPTMYSMGGISIVSKEVNEEANGWCNQYWGWGGEDRNYLDRIKALALCSPTDEVPCIRGSVEAKLYFRELEGYHEEGRKSTKKKNQKVTKRFRNDPSLNKTDGLNNCRYQLERVIHMEIPECFPGVKAMEVKANITYGANPEDVN